MGEFISLDQIPEKARRPEVCSRHGKPAHYHGGEWCCPVCHNLDRCAVIRNTAGVKIGRLDQETDTVYPWTPDGKELERSDRRALERIARRRGWRLGD